MLPFYMFVFMQYTISEEYFTTGKQLYSYIYVKFKEK